VKTIWTVFLVLIITGCSNKAVYDNIRHSNRQACANVPPPQYEECLDRSGKPYEEYERERKEVVGED
jgi:PBP1b-binding outer membrane lipoprotein LpoB